MTSTPCAPPGKPLARALVLALAALATTSLGAREASAADPPAAAAPPKLDIPYTKYALDNGLTVILHEDRSLPLVAVNISVKVGSRFEEARRTGFAHLFEHLMFMGTKRAPTKMFDAWMEAEGGWNNAFTSEDRTGYFDVGPARILPLLLWLEADRFASLADNMNEEKLNAQREVVRNERRQTSENEPYGKVELRLPELMYPEGHPYHHPVIGSHEDLQAATVDDVKSFFRRWYVPNNASLVVAGDFDKNQIKDTIQKLFGAIPRSAEQPARPVPPSKLMRVVRESIPDNVQFPKVVMAWHSPARFEPGDAEMDLTSVILQEGKASRLYKSLVYDKRLAQEVHAYQASGDIGSQFVVEAIAAPNVKPTELEAAMDAEIAKIADKPVTAEELQRAKNQFEMGFVARLQSVAQRAEILNQYQTQRGDPGYAEKDLERYRKVTPESLLSAAKGVLDLKGRVIIYVLPAEGQGGDKAPEKGGAK